MATVNVQVTGGAIQQKQASTLADIKAMFQTGNIKYTATVNGEPENDDNYQLSDYEFVTLTESVKGA